MSPRRRFTRQATAWRTSVRDRALARRGYQLRVLGQHAARVTRFGLLPFFSARSEFLRRHVELDQQLVRIDGDRIPAFDERDRAADKSLRRNVTDHHAPGAAREAAVGDE